MKTHSLKTWPEPFQAVWDDLKPYELRKDDRDYQVGDVLELLEYEPVDEKYSGRKIRAPILYKFDDIQFGLEIGCCILTLGQKTKITKFVWPLPDTFNSPCPVCGGRGWIDVPENKWNLPVCPSCGGNGLRRDEKPEPKKL